ncbi:sulfite exporter TauE/SafE family protein, partial [bacterium]|nr:sulfite exporter TauE/SafE family protein [bacterium]
WLALGAMAGAQIGSHLASLVPQGGLKGGFSFFVIVSGISFLFRAFRKKRFSLELHFKRAWVQTLFTLAIGLGIGLSTGLFGTGGGATVLVVLIYVMSFPIHLAIGTATAIMAAAAASGVVGYTVQGHIPWLDGIVIGLAAIASGLLFSRIANRASEKALNLAVGIIFIVIGIAMFFVEGGTGVMNSVRAVLS